MSHPRRFPRARNPRRPPAWILVPLGAIVLLAFVSFALAASGTTFGLSLAALVILTINHLNDQRREGASPALAFRRLGTDPVLAASACVLISGGIFAYQAYTATTAGGEDAPEPARYNAAANISRVVDGDTVEIEPAINGNDTVRLIGVDAPETDHPQCGEQPYGPEATAYATDRLADQTVELEFDLEMTDQYGRLLAYVYLQDGEMINETLLSEGHAQVATFPPNTRYTTLFEFRQQAARGENRGLWGLSEEELTLQTDRGNGIGGEC